MRDVLQHRGYWALEAETRRGRRGKVDKKLPRNAEKKTRSYSTPSVAAAAPVRAAITLSWRDLGTAEEETRLTAKSPWGHQVVFVMVFASRFSDLRLCPGTWSELSPSTARESAPPLPHRRHDPLIGGRLR